MIISNNLFAVNVTQLVMDVRIENSVFNVLQIIIEYWTLFHRNVYVLRDFMIQVYLYVKLAILYV
jgi:hypothetical protein